MSNLLISGQERPFLQWTNGLPLRWERKRFKHLGTFVGGGTPSKDNEELWKGNIPWVSPKDMKASKVVDTEDHISIQAIDASSTSLLPIGCLLIVVRSGILKHTIPVATNAVAVTLNQDMKGFVPGKSVLSQYLLYLIQGNQSTFLLEWRKAGATVESLENEFLTNSILPVPPLPEQRAIAAFLDRKTAQIDAVVAKKQRLIELLQEKRQSLISHAVTKGLDPHAPMKDSGIEWLGEIPAHWTLSKLGYVANIVRGASPRPAGDPLYFNGDAAPWITVAEVTKDSCKYLTSTSTCLTPEGQALSRLLRSGTLILTNSGATLGVPKIIQIDGCINDGSVAFLGIRRSVSKDYLYYFLSSLTQMLRERASGQGQPNLNTDIVKAIPFPFGSLEEQDRIVAFVEAESNRISNVMDALQNQIAKLQEYRQTLISAAVTGKIDVTKEAAC